MNTPSSISRRINDCLRAYARADHEGALVHLFPALDKVAKRRRPRAGVGERIRSFLSDEEGLISAVATGSVLQCITVNGVTFPEAIYRFGRTSIAHEGELDSRLTITTDGSLSIGTVWALPATYILGLSVAVMAAPESATERIAGEATITVCGTTWRLNDLWGARDRLKLSIAAAFGNPQLFRQ